MRSWNAMASIGGANSQRVEVCKLQEAIGLLVSAVLCVVIGTWLIGDLSPKNTPFAPQMKHDIQRSAVRWLSMLVASVVGAYKLHDIIDLIITAIR